MKQALKIKRTEKRRWKFETMEKSRKSLTKNKGKGGKPLTKRIDQKKEKFDAAKEEKVNFVKL